MSQLLEGGAAQVTVPEKCQHRLIQVTQSDIALQQRLKGSAQDHQLMDQMADLQALIIISRRLPVDSCILVLQGMALVLLAVEALKWPVRLCG